MIRVVLVNLLLFLLPFVLFALYVWLTGRRGERGGWFDDAPLITLSGAGVVLVVAMMSFFISFEGTKPGGAYIPPSFRDGKIQPGHTEPDLSSRRFAGPREPENSSGADPAPATSSDQ